jgi:hypothetical protein
MAITSFTIPSGFQPAYNPCILTFESNKIAEKGFRYILIAEDDTFTEITRFSIPPRIGDGLGYSDVSKIIQSKLDYYSPINIALFQDGIKPQYQVFRFLIGEEYQVAYTYSGPQQNGLYVELIGTSATTFIAGDQININQADGGVAMPQLQGLFTVVSVSGNDVTINVLWADITPSVIAGSVTYVDGRKTQFLNQFDETIDMFKSAFSFKDFQSYVSTDYILADGLVKKPLSNIPLSGFKITPTQDLFIWLYANQLTGTQIKVLITSFNQLGIEGSYEYLVDTVAEGQMIRVAGDFTGVTPTFGILPVVKDTTTQLRVRITTLANVNVTDFYLFDINQDCLIEDYEIMFLDRLGSWGSFAFPLKARGTVKANKKSYEQELGTVDNTGFSYELDNVGREVYNVEASEDIELTTGFLTDEMSEYFEQLITSPKAFIKIDGFYYGCDILTDSTPIERLKNKRLIRKTIQVRLANDTPING